MCMEDPFSQIHNCYLPKNLKPLGNLHLLELMMIVKLEFFIMGWLVEKQQMFIQLF